MTSIGWPVQPMCMHKNSCQRTAPCVDRCGLFGPDMRIKISTLSVPHTTPDFSSPKMTAEEDTKA